MKTKKEILANIYKDCEKEIDKTNVLQNSIYVFFLLCFSNFFIKLSEQGFLFNEIFIMDTISGLVIFTAVSISIIIAIKLTTGTFPFLSGIFIWLHGFMYLIGSPISLNFMRIGALIYVIFAFVKIKIIVWDLKDTLTKK